MIEAHHKVAAEVCHPALRHGSERARKQGRRLSQGLKAQLRSADAKEVTAPASRRPPLANSIKIDALELSAVELGREVARHFQASLGLGDLGFQPLFHGRLLR